jgi:hypothetical protein
MPRERCLNGLWENSVWVIRQPAAPRADSPRIRGSPIVCF